MSCGFEAQRPIYRSAEERKKECRLRCSDLFYYLKKTIVRNALHGFRCSATNLQMLIQHAVQNQITTFSI
jgi:hypothetical protein